MRASAPHGETNPWKQWTQECQIGCVGGAERAENGCFEAFGRFGHRPYFELFSRNTGGFLPGNLEKSRLPGFCVLKGFLNEYENRAGIFVIQSRYLNTAFRHSALHMRLQMPAASYISAFDEGGLHCKTGYIHLHSVESGVLTCIPGDMPLLF